MTRRILQAASWVVATVLAIPAFACVNTFVSEIKELKGMGNHARVAKVVASADAAYRFKPSLETANDLAVAWILTDRVSEGVQLLRDVEKRYPANAIVAANLGTALELSGNDAEALQWIRESVRRDPEEHQGSEWVHVRILEAKLALRNDPNWLRKNAVVGWREGQRFPPDEESRPRRPRDMIAAITYQLQERTQFVDAPDAVVGDLYLSIGDIAFAVPGAYSSPWERDSAISSNYHSAIHFGTVHEARARERMEAADKRKEAVRPAMQAAAAREQEAQARELVRDKLAAQRKADLESAQLRRRWLAFGAFGTFCVLVAGAVFLRHKRATKP